MHESKSESEVAQSYLTLSDPMDCSLLGSSVHRTFQARVLEWGATAFSNHLSSVLLKRALSLERLRAGGAGDDRGWDGWMASPTQWTWVWVNSRPGVLRFLGSQRVEHDWETELNWGTPRKLVHREKSYEETVRAGWGDLPSKEVLRETNPPTLWPWIFSLSTARK